MKIISKLRALGALSMSFMLTANTALASSHREAPLITEIPKVDGTDFYMFRSYENGRSDFITIIANYHPLQDAYGGPNYFSMDPDAIYSIKVDNSGDAREDLEFRFQFNNTLKSLSLNIDNKTVAVPQLNIGAINASDTGSLNVIETYTVDVIRDRKERRASSITNASTNSSSFLKPVDNIGQKSIADYAAYANSHIYNINIPGCNASGAKMFVGQRKEGFVVNLGEVFDLVNTNPVGARNGEANTIADKNITSLALEIPISCLTRGSDTNIAAWTTASLPKTRTLNKKPSFDNPARERGSFIQVSRLANPLVNEVVIGLKDKDLFNASLPRNDAQFATYVQYPTLPAILNVLFSVRAPTLFPRSDLVAIFLTGVEGLNKTAATAEMMRLNTSIAPVAAASQNNLGVIAGDNAGYPNGRRPGDDVVDISLRAVMGVLLSASDAPDGQLAYTDGAAVSATDFATSFPYLVTPVAGSPN